MAELQHFSAGCPDVSVGLRRRGGGLLGSAGGGGFCFFLHLLMHVFFSAWFFSRGPQHLFEQHRSSGGFQVPPVVRGDCADARRHHSGEALWQKLGPHPKVPFVFSDVLSSPRLSSHLISPTFSPPQACAPLYSWRTEKDDFPRSDVTGTCYLSAQNFTSFVEYAPCRTGDPSLTFLKLLY